MQLTKSALQKVLPNLRRNSLYKRFFLASCLLLSFALPAEAEELKLYPETCNKKYTNPLRVKVSNHEFHVLINDPLAVIQNNLISDRHISTSQCQKPNDPAIEATFVKFSPKELTNKFARPTTREKWVQFVPIIALYSNPDSQLSLQDPYQIVRKRLESEKLKLTDLPREGDFYLLKGQEKIDPTFYIAADKTFITPAGTPVTLFCSPYNGLNSHIIKCSTRFTWKDNITISIGNVDNTHVYFEDWKNFYSSALRHVEEMENLPAVTKFESENVQ